MTKTRKVTAHVEEEKPVEDGMTEEPAAPRPAARDDEASKSRHRRMFAGLLGTLNKSKSDNESERDVMAKRKSIEAEVSGKNEEISRELREAQYKAFTEQRDADEKAKFELDMKYKETERTYIEVQYEEWKRLVSAGGILTVTEPMLVYTLNVHTPETSAKAQASAERLEQWRTKELERVDNAIKVIARRREEIAERRANARARGEENGEDVDIEIEDHEDADNDQELTMEGIEDEDMKIVDGGE